MNLINTTPTKQTSLIKDRNLSNIDKICSSYMCLENPKYIDIDGI